MVNDLIEKVLSAAASSDQRIADLLADALRQRGVRARRDRLAAGLFVLAIAIGAVLDRAALDNNERDRAVLVREVKRMAHAYIHTLA